MVVVVERWMQRGGREWFEGKENKSEKRKSETNK